MIETLIIYEVYRLQDASCITLKTRKKKWCSCPESNIHNMMECRSKSNLFVNELCMCAVVLELQEGGRIALDWWLKA